MNYKSKRLTLFLIFFANFHVTVLCTYAGQNTRITQTKTQPLRNKQISPLAHYKVLDLKEFF